MRIEVQNLTQKYGKVTALKNVNLQLEENTIYGLLGRNGAGKSTLLKVLANRLVPSKGRVCLDGAELTENDRAQAQIFLMSEVNLYPRTMSIQKAFQWTARFYEGFDTEKAMRLCETFSLNPKKTVSTLSTGQNTIYKAIIALCLNVPFLFLDEPVLGMDANNREVFYKELLKSYEEHPKTIVLATHLIEEVSGIMEHVVMIKNGEIIVDSTVEDLLAKSYKLSGTTAQMTPYLEAHSPLTVETLGKMQTAYFLDEPLDRALVENLTVSGVQLQDLFVKLTNV